jgi:hypothetical protein
LVQAMWLPIDSPSVLREVVAHAEPYFGPPGSAPTDTLLLAVWGSRGGDLFVQPIVLSGRVVALLCVDDLQYGPMGRERIEAVVTALVEAFERIIVDSKTR